MYTLAIFSIGLGYMVSCGVVLGIKELDVIARRALFLGILIMIPGMISAAAGIRLPYSPHPALTNHHASSLGFAVLSLNLYLALLTAELYLLIKRGRGGLMVKAVAVGAFLTALVIQSRYGALFGPAYGPGPFSHLYFLLSALIASSALIIMVTVLTYKLKDQPLSLKLEAALRNIGKLLVGLLAVGGILLYWKMSFAHYAGAQEALLLTGPYMIHFWVFVVLLGYIIPILIVTLSRFKPSEMAAAATLALIGLFISANDFAIVSKLAPHLGLSPFAGEPGGAVSFLSSYWSNFTKIAGGIGFFALVWTGYILGVKYLPLEKNEA
jgi:hypothetical protein